MADQYRMPADVSGSFNKLMNRTKKQEEPLDPEYMDQYKQAMLAADREMENPQLMAEYWANQRYLDKELGNTRPSPIETIKGISKANRAPISKPLPTKTTSLNERTSNNFGIDDVEGNALEAGYKPQNTPLNAPQPFDGSNALSKAALATMLAGGAGAAGYGISRLPINASSEIQDVLLNPRMGMNAMEPAVQSLPQIRSDMYKADLTPRSIPREMSNQLPPSRITPEQLDYNILQSKAGANRPMGTPNVESFGSNPTSKFNVGPGGATESGMFQKFKGFPKAAGEFVPQIESGAMAALKRFGAPIVKGLASGVAPEMPQEHLDQFKADTIAKLKDQEDAMLLAKHTKMTYDEALNKIRAERNL